MPTKDQKLILGKAHLTEKSSAQAANDNHPVYTFVVEKNLGKGNIKREVIKRYGVTPIKINIIKTPTKKIIYRGHIGYKPGFTKALVFLKAGDKIDHV